MKKLLNKKGFTLMEMLIVVAIIVILVAVAVPTFTSSLDDAKKATDAANLRAAKTAAQIEYVNGDLETGHTYYFDIVEGKVKEGTYSGTGDGECSNHSADGVHIEVELDGTVHWSNDIDCDGNSTTTTPTNPSESES